MFISMGVWQGVVMDSLKFYPGLPCQTLLNPAVSGVACLLGGRPLAVFYLFEHPTPYAYVYRFLLKRDRINYS
jgi:hypothetical protein